LRGDVPEGVTFLGFRAAAEIATLLDTHDLFVMPSRFEGFGIAFAEALVRGLPCIGRDACAMPEIIDRASGGRLVTSESPDELADLIVDTLADDALYAACAAAVTARRAHFTWERAAEQVAAIAEGVRR
jgi:glycosyltransferase involved in cell wall biosynthesis